MLNSKVNFKFNNVLIFGYSKSGKSAEQLIKKIGCNYFVFDENLKLQGGNYLMKLNKKKLQQFDLIVLSPGISIYNKYIKLAKKLNILVVSELELGFWFCNSKIIAITGTNGKTTVTTIIENVLNSNGFKAKSFGNIGTPFTSIVNYNNLDYAVVEVSSFQLESVHEFKPDIAIILNITEDHIDRHKNMQNYVNCKLKLLNNIDKNTKILLNADDKIILDNVKDYKFYNKNINYISLQEMVDGYSVIENNLYYTNHGTKLHLAKLSDLKNLNTYLINVLFVLAVSDLLNISISKTIKEINNFKTLNSRAEVVNRFLGVDYVNDSKATNIDAVLKAVKTQSKDVYLLLGGKDKALNFKPIFNSNLNNLNTVIAFGQARSKIVKVAKKCGFNKVFSHNSLEDAVIFASSIAKNNSVVLLSPGCASFDAYNSYVERGVHFKQIVESIKQNINNHYEKVVKK